MVHIQYPVGQGGLHLGILGNVAYIYDCGSVYENRSIRCITDVIDKLKKYNINCILIFVSHLHADHVCAVYELLKKLPNGVRYKLYLPYITPLEKLYLIIANANIYDMNSWYRRFVMRPQSILDANREGTVVLVSDTSVDGDNDIGIVRTYGQLCKELQSLIASQYVLDPFVYSGFNSRVFEKCVRALAGTQQWPLDDKAMDALIDKQFSDLEKTYKLLHYDINCTCLCLYCGVSEPPQYDTAVIFAHTCCLYGCQYKVKHGWLHTGDYNLRCGKNSKYGRKFVEHYKQYFDRVGVVQIPHHGSQSNISHIFIDYFKTQNVVFFMTGEIRPVGRGQPQRATSVLKAISQPVLWVSELPCSAIVQYK